MENLLMVTNVLVRLGDEMNQVSGPDKETSADDSTVWMSHFVPAKPAEVLYNSARPLAGAGFSTG